MRKVILALCLQCILFIASAQGVFRYPNIQSPTQTSVIIAWNSDTSYTGTLKWGTSAGSLTNTLNDPANTTTHAITIYGLQPNTEYYYQASGTGFQSAVEHFFTAKPDSVKQLSFVVFGDCGFATSQQDNISAQMAAQPADFGLVVGDVDQYFGVNYDADYFQHYTNATPSKCYFTAIGNHDILTNNTNYTDAFYLPHNNPDSSELYYSFTWGNAKFIALDGNISYTAGSAQYTWLQSQLQCNTSEWLIVFFHQPPWTNAWDVSWYIPFTPFYMYVGNTDMRTSIVPLFEQYHVDFVLNGHAHDYQSGVYNGVHYQIAGGGGTSTPDTHVSSSAPDIQFEADVNNYMYFSINGDTIHYNAYNLNGTVIDSLTLSKTPTAPFNAGLTITEPRCYGMGNGKLVANSTGQYPPFSYNWSTGSGTNTASPLSAGTYTVTITDGIGCARVDTIPLPQPQPITGSSNITDVTCHGANNGKITLNVTGGTQPYQYRWNTGATTDSLINLHGTIYTAYITDNSLCMDTVRDTVLEPALLTDSILTSNASCSSSNGSISLTAAGGTLPYHYHWSTGDTTQNINGVAAATYTVIITDGNNCTKLSSAVVAQAGGLTLQDSIKNVSCFGNNDGSVSITVSGGVQPYQYLWNVGGTTNSLTGLSGGQFILAIQDSAGCTDTARVSVIEPTLLTDSIIATNALCNGNSNGAVTLIVSGGTAPYSFSWSTGDTTRNLNNLGSGTYNVTISDANHCTKYNGASITQSRLQVADTITNVTCHGDNNGAISLTPSGGILPYQYAWNTGATTNSLGGLGGGQYSVFIRDSTGCADTIHATVIDPALLTDSITSSNEVCAGNNNGTISLTVTGGTGGYSYIWNTGDTVRNLSGLANGTFSVTIADANNCQKLGSTTIALAQLSLQDSVKNETCPFAANGSITVNASGGVGPYQYTWSSAGNNHTALTAGSYTVTVADLYQCSTTKSFNIITSGGNSRPTLSAPDSIICGADSVPINATPGFANYNWNTGAQTSSIYAHSAGAYYVAAHDSFGCLVNSDTLSFSAGSVPHAVLTDTISGLTVHLTAAQGTAGTYHWALGNGDTITGTSANLDYTYADSGYYKVILVTQYSCGNDTSSLTLYIADSTAGILNTNGAEINVTLEPNPFHDMTTLAFNHPLNQAVQVTLYNLDGKLIRNYGLTGNTALTIHKGDLAAGVYVLHLDNDQIRKTLKLVVE